MHQIRHAKDYGLAGASAEFDFAQAMERVRQVVAAIEPHDSVERYTASGSSASRARRRSRRHGRWR
jgi:hypothetical protein